MKILVTGSAGFIGFHVANALLERGHSIIGIDNINSYYDVELKYDRLQEAGIARAAIGWNSEVSSSRYNLYSFIRLHLEDRQAILDLCNTHKFDVVVHLAAQAGVRYSLVNPDAYIQSNVVGFLSILEACRYNKMKHLIYASSSSVYGLNEQIPFSVQHNTNHPASLYAATKKANELMAHTYSHLYNIPTTGLRFFTVYGPWGRPDMACFLFTDAIVQGKPIQVFNQGKMKRDFTYIDDIVTGILSVMSSPAAPDPMWNGKRPDPATSSAPYRIFNIGNNSPVDLLYFIQELEKNLGKKAVIEMKELQPGDIAATWANVDDLISHFKYKPDTSIETGLKKYTAWYKKYYGISNLAKAKLEEYSGGN